MGDGRVIRVALGDDSYLTREALTHLLEAAQGIELVAACEDEGSLLRAVGALNPEVVVTDIRMPPTNTDEGLRIAAVLRRTHPEMGSWSSASSPSLATAWRYWSTAQTGGRTC